MAASLLGHGPISAGPISGSPDAVAAGMPFSTLAFQNPPRRRRRLLTTHDGPLLNTALITPEVVPPVVDDETIGGGFIPFQRKSKRKRPPQIEELVEAAIEALPNPTPTQVAKKVIPQVRQYYVLDNRREIAALRAEITRLVLAIQEENDNEDEAAFLLFSA